jgi:Na+/proline symporter
MRLVAVDWVIVLGTILICFVPALFFGKRAGKSTSEFFASGRAVPWWLAGLSMVATTFSSDTPNWVTQQVRQYGVAGNWQWWAMVLTGVATVFFFARLWRRSGVMTDLEFYELRYSGKAASVVRGFRAVYLGLFFNCFIMAMVTLAACKIANVLFGLPQWQTIAICGVLNVVFAAHAGLWGVLVIDMVQFFIKMTAVIAAAYFSLKEVARHTGVGDSAVAGLHKLVEILGPQQVTFQPGGQPVLTAIDGTGQPVLNVMPNFAMGELALMIFIVPIAIGWWANWYPGAEPGGGSYIAQRMLASKSEKDSLGGTLFFNLAHYVLRPWPWIITALCSIVIFPELKDIQAAFPGADPRLIGHDSAFPAMLKFLPVGFAGLMLGGLIAANSSTILTHLNWGSSYLVHDFYRRFLRRHGTPLCDSGTDLHGGALSRGGPSELRARVGAGRIRGPHLDRRRHRPSLPAPVVLVADQCMDRSRGDDQLVRHLARVLRDAEDRARPAVRAHRPDFGRVHDRLLADRRVYQRADQPRAADRVLHEGASRGTRLAGDPGSGRRQRSRTGPARRPHGARDPRLDLGVCGDLVVAVRHRQLPVRAHGARADADGGLRAQRQRPPLRDQHPVGPPRRAARGSRTLDFGACPHQD